LTQNPDYCYLVKQSDVDGYIGDILMERQTPMNESGDERLNQIQAELAAILEERLGALNKFLQVTESATRRIIAADVEMERHRINESRLKAEQHNIEAEVVLARESVSTIRAENARKAAERDRLNDDISGHERAIRELDANAELARKKIAGLESEANTLREENTTLRTKVKTLQENILRMQRLKDELMNSVTGLAKQLRQASGAE
jgi:chromosome segregation ATPase